MKGGLCGKPSSGKSTFFKAATLAEVEISARPFVTIKPNTGVGYVKVDCVDKEFNVQCNPRDGFCLENKRFDRTAKEDSMSQYFFPSTFPSLIVILAVWK